MFNWLKQWLHSLKKRNQTQDAINNLYTSNGKNRTPLDPDNNPWQS